MDSNKEAAIQVLDLAEKKFKSKDIKYAMKLALKAQRLFPSLGNLKQTIAAYQVHLAAAKTDWHAVLHVDPSADIDTIKKQFKKMCLLTHPDKNRRSSAADGAFKMVMKAWSILSSTAKSSSSTSKPTKKPDQEYLHAKIRCDKCTLLRFWDFSRTDHKSLYHYCKGCSTLRAIIIRLAKADVPLTCEGCDCSLSFSRTDHKSLYHYCKGCSTWRPIIIRLAKANVPLTCEGCDCNLSWGSYGAFGYDCSNCNSYYVVGVDPNWIPKAESRGGESSYQPEICH